MYLYELPTTGAIAFADFLIDQQKNYPAGIADATQARANLRAALKQSKRADDGEKDYLRITKALDDYLPSLYAIIHSIQLHALALRSVPVFSWRTTLSSSPLLTPQNPRLSFPSLHADLLFCHLTQAFALSNTAHAVVSSLGQYEHTKHISDANRKLNDERVNHAVNLLCRASGLFTHLAEMDPIQGASVRPPDLSREVLNALAKLALADAQSLAIRKLMSRSAYDSALTPGPPLPKSHPSPVLIAKLYLEITESLAVARTLAKTPAATPSTSSSTSKFKFGKKDKKSTTKDDATSEEQQLDTEDMSIHGEVSSELRKYLADECAFSAAMAHKWLGVDAGEQGRAGEAVGFLRWAKEELDSLGGGGSKIGKEKERHRGRKERLAEEVRSVEMFLKGYLKMNDTIHFQPVPKMADLQALIPSGRMAVTAKKFEPPVPAFGVVLMNDLEEGVERLDLDSRSTPSREQSHYF